MFAIHTENLVKHYKDITAVNGLSLNVNEGELVSLLGVNGAGKTTTIKLLCCLAKPDAGDAFICGKSILSQSAEVKALIGVSPQETAVSKALSVKENLDLICAVHRLDKEETRKGIGEMCALFDLESILSRPAGKLSGGWQRRLSIAMALIGKPKVLFLDEPTLGLDVLARRDLWELITRLKGKMTVILTTHYMEEAEALSDRIAIMQGGRLMRFSTAEEIKRSADTDDFEEAFIRTVRGAV